MGLPGSSMLLCHMVPCLHWPVFTCFPHSNRKAAMLQHLASISLSCLAAVYMSSSHLSQQAVAAACRYRVGKKFVNSALFKRMPVQASGFRHHLPEPSHFPDTLAKSDLADCKCTARCLAYGNAARHPRLISPPSIDSVVAGAGGCAIEGSSMCSVHLMAL